MAHMAGRGHLWCNIAVPENLSWYTMAVIDVDDYCYHENIFVFGCFFTT